MTRYKTGDRVRILWGKNLRGRRGTVTHQTPEMVWVDLDEKEEGILESLTCYRDELEKVDE